MQVIPRKNCKINATSQSRLRAQAGSSSACRESTFACREQRAAFVRLNLPSNMCKDTRTRKNTSTSATLFLFVPLKTRRVEKKKEAKSNPASNRQKQDPSWTLSCEQRYIRCLKNAKQYIHSRGYTNPHTHDTATHAHKPKTHLEILPAGVGVKALHGDAVLRAAGSELGAVGAVPAAGLDDDARTVELAAVHFCGQQRRPRPTAAVKKRHTAG